MNKKILSTIKILKEKLQDDAFKRLDEIKVLISEKTETKIDLAPKNNLSKTAQKYILSEVIYV
jgi:predicted nucleotidyltransferase